MIWEISIDYNLDFGAEKSDDKSQKSRIIQLFFHWVVVHQNEINYRNKTKILNES